MWKNIDINKQNIEVEGVNSYLIKMPNKSDYEGYVFYHPSKLVREGRNKNSISIGYTEDFIFVLKKFGKGKYNRFEVLKETKISSEEFEKQFKEMDENIVSSKIDKESYLKVEEPKKINKEIEILEELKNE